MYLRNLLCKTTLHTLEIQMSKIETNAEQNKTVNTLKENYIRRIDEIDSFSTRFTSMCSEINNEVLYGWLNIAQHCLDLQKKYSYPYASWFPSDITSKVIKQNTEAWIQAVHNIDSICIDSMKNIKNNLAGVNKSSVQCIQNMGRIHDICKNNNTSPNPNKEVVSEIMLKSGTTSESKP